MVLVDYASDSDREDTVVPAGKVDDSAGSTAAEADTTDRPIKRFVPS